MVDDAKKYEEDDKKQKAKIESKNSLENYVYSLRNSVNDQLKEKLGEEDRVLIETKVSETITWLDEHPDEDVETYDARRKELEEAINPIMTKMYSQEAAAAGAAEAGGEMPAQEEPTVEEVD